MIEPLRRGGVFFQLCSWNNSSRSCTRSRQWCPSLLYFPRDILFMFQQEKYFCLKLVTFSNLQWKLHKIFFLESYKGRRKIMTLLFTIYKSLAEFLISLSLCFLVYTRQGTVIHTYEVDEGIELCQ